MITDEARRRTVAALHALATDSGGFPATAGGPATMAGTLSTVKALALLGDRPRDPDAVHAFVTGQLDVVTGRWRDPATGKLSVLATAAGVLCLRAVDARVSLDRWLDSALRAMIKRADTREEHFMTIAVVDECGLDVRLPRSTSFFRALEQPDGTFGPDPLQNAIAASALLRAGEVLRDPESVGKLLLASQTPAGGFADDRWTTYCAMRALDLLGIVPDTARLVPWVLAALLDDGGFAALDEGGFAAGPAMSADLTYQSLSVLDWIAAPVLDAARAGDEAALTRHLHTGGDPDIRDLLGWTPLAAAAVRGQASAVRLLLDAHADPDLRVADADALPIFWAGQHGDTETVQALLERRPEHLFATSSVNGHTVLLQAVFFGTRRHCDLVAWLITHVGGLAEARHRLLAACNVRGCTATDMAALWHNETLTALLSPVDDTTAAERDEYRTRLIASIARPAEPATDALIATITAGLAELNNAVAGAEARLIAAVTAAVSAPGFDINLRGGPLAETPVIVAVTGTDADERVAAARVRLTSLLLRHGADPDLPEVHPMGVDAVIRAAVLNHFACLQEISRFMGPLAFAAALNERPAVNGQTALDDTVHRALTAPDGTVDSHLEQIRWAIGRGARTDIADLTGVTAADRARSALGDPVLAVRAPAVLAALSTPEEPPPR